MTDSDESEPSPADESPRGGEENSGSGSGTDESEGDRSRSSKSLDIDLPDTGADLAREPSGPVDDDAETAQGEEAGESPPDENHQTLMGYQARDPADTESFDEDTDPTGVDFDADDVADVRSLDEIERVDDEGEASSDPGAARTRERTDTDEDHEVVAGPPGDEPAPEPDDAGPPTPTAPPDSGPASPGASAPATRGSPEGSAPTGGASAESDHSEETFSDQETALFDSPFENDPICPRLKVLDGPEAGKEFLLNDMRNSIGRATDNNVVIADEAMSRQHFEITENPDESHTLQDLQSVNGTYLNGKKIEEASLFHGDRIKVGQTELQFVVPGKEPQQQKRNRQLVPASAETEAGRAESPSPAAPVSTRAGSGQTRTWLNRIIAGAGALSVLIAAAAGGIVWYQSRSAQQERATARKAYLAGIEALEARNWERAETKLERAVSTDPQLDATARLERIALEIDSKKKLERSRSAFEAGRREEALELAQSIPSESIYHERARQLVRRQRRRERLTDLYRRALEAHEEENDEEALSKIREILDVIPNHEKALVLKYRIQRADQPDEETKPVGARGAAGAPAPRGSGRASESDDSGSWLLSGEGSSGSNGGQEAAEPESPSSESSSDSSQVVNFTEGFNYYKREQFDRAVEHFRAAAESAGGSVSERSSRAAANIEAFREAFDRARSSLSNGDWAEAREQLRRALEADREVAEAGFMKTNIDPKLAEATAKMGLKRVDAELFAQAYDQLTDAKQYDENAPAVRELRRRLEEEAESLYIRARQSRKTDPGETAELCRTIMSMLPQNSEFHGKAKELLDEI